ncbi:MAG TPA: glycosyltransferase family 1 protein [Solirubrobacteraceae bacterium]|nr:glycosyltransferase family 1 protein [Solirubrobacteraceae bacterium]
MTLRVAIDARALDLPYLRGQGMGRYTASLLEALIPVSHERRGELVLMRAAGAPDSPFAGTIGDQPVELRRPRLPEPLAMPVEQALLPRDLRRVGADLLHCTAVYRAAPRPGRPWILSLHDVIPLLFRREYLRSGLLYRLMYAAARRATLILTVSQCSRQDIVARLGVAPERVHVVPGAAGQQFRPTPPDPNLLSELGITSPYVLYVGGLAEHDPRKRVPELVDAFAAWSAAGGRPEMLVLTGRLGTATDGLRDQVRRTGARVVLTGFVPDEVLPPLYSGAACLVSASAYEGFDLPALEALACGTPVAAHRVGAHEEVVGPGALLVDDQDMAALMRAVQTLSDNPELRARLRDAGQAHAARFSWRRSAELTWDAYERVMAPRG